MGWNYLSILKLQLLHGWSLSRDKQFHPHFIIYVITYPDSKVHGANMGPTWVLSAPDGPHVGPMNLVIRVPILGLKLILPHWQHVAQAVTTLSTRPYFNDNHITWAIHGAVCYQRANCSIDDSDIIALLLSSCQIRNISPEPLLRARPWSNGIPRRLDYSLSILMTFCSNSTFAC